MTPSEQDLMLPSVFVFWKNVPCSHNAQKCVQGKAGLYFVLIWVVVLFVNWFPTSERVPFFPLEIPTQYKSWVFCCARISPGRRGQFFLFATWSISPSPRVINCRIGEGRVPVRSLFFWPPWVGCGIFPKSPSPCFWIFKVVSTSEFWFWKL